MNHKVQNVEELYRDAEYLYAIVVCGTTNGADEMLGDLQQAVEILKNNWKGADAGVKIQEIVSVHNELIEVRNALALLARDSSKVASNYRRIQLENGAPLGELIDINVSEKTILPDYVDTADTIDINPEADGGRALVDAVRDAIDGFILEARKTKDNILGNWQIGTGRNNADEAFNKFESNAKQNKDKLLDVSANITRALQNYQF